MHLVAITSFLVAAVALCHAQGTAIVNAVDHWCGQWAGALDIADAIPDQLLPGTYPSDKKLFIEPQLQRVPFSPVMGPEERIQVPKLWGNREPNPLLTILPSHASVHQSVWWTSV